MSYKTLAVVRSSRRGESNGLYHPRCLGVPMWENSNELHHPYRLGILG